MKECTLCGAVKPLDEFYKNKATEDGLTYRCKVCLNIYSKSVRDKANANKPEGWKKKTENVSLYMKEWKLKNPGYMTAAKKRYWDKNKERLNVKSAVRYAIKTGKLIKQPCFVCGEETVEGHHPDYSKPLNVIWLCRKHHIEVHKK